MTKKNKHDPAQAPGNAQREDAAAENVEIKTGSWVEAKSKPLRKEFPASDAGNEALRVAMSAEASAEIISHAKESLDAEVCGVLVGHICEDDAGNWVWVKAAIRGESTRQGGAHVTYTQETWRKIHDVKDRKYANLTIVGWYHSHPGFGVEFSDMDLFIQKNFFSGPSQMALVLDPLSGDEAICFNAENGIEHVSRFWVDGRRRICRTPTTSKETQDETSDQGVASKELTRRLQSVEERLRQMLQATDEERVHRYMWRVTIGMLLAIAIIAWIGMTIYKPFMMRDLPPEEYAYSEIPVRIGDDNAMVGVKIVTWKLPHKYEEAFVEAIKQKIVDEVKARKEEQQETQEDEASQAKEEPKSESN